MTKLFEDLKELEYRLEEEGYDIDQYEVRESVDEPSSLDGRPLQRAEGSRPSEVAIEWGSLDGEDYVIEIFMGGDTPLDRLVYKPGRELETISFSGRSYDVDIEGLLEAGNRARSYSGQ